MSVDKFWRLYFHPASLYTRPLDESAGVILHELSHLLFKHHKRVENVVPVERTPEQWHRWNVAVDYSVNYLLREQGIPLWKGMLFPEDDGFPGGLAGEEYYRLLTDKAEEQKQQQEEQQQRQAEEDDADDDEADDDSDESDDSDEGGEDESDDDGQDGESGQEGKESGDGEGEPTDDAGEADGDSERSDSGEGSGGESDGATEDEGSPADSCNQRTAGVEQPNSNPGCGDGGSCADGQQRPWELPEPTADDGLKDYEADILARDVADRIMNKAAGNTAGKGFLRWAKEVITPKVDPRTALLRHVRQAVELTSGQGEFSYRRPNRRNPSHDMLRPAAFQPIPRITIVCDTSGSMDKRDLGLSLGLIGKVLKSFRIRDGITVMCGDTQAATVAKVFDPRQVVLGGGGGTDMGNLIIQASQQKPAPQLIVVATDGITGWCEPVKVPVVACITRTAGQEMWPVPPWIKQIVLDT